MARYDAMKEYYEPVELFGKPVIFNDMRLDSKTIPKGLYLYELRHDDEGGFDPVQIAKGILVNHYGSIISNEPIKLPERGIRDIDPETDWKYSDHGCRTVKDYMEKFPPIKKRERER